MTLEISIHALREEGDLRSSIRATSRPLFLSTPSARRATRVPRRPPRHQRDFYPRPPRGGRRVHRLHPRGTQQFLSTPSARRATICKPVTTPPEQIISIHALREEGDVTASAMSFRTWYFYPRPPRGGRPAALRPATPEHWISIHALREEGDVPGRPTTPATSDFYPRPPRGGRPACACLCV